MKADVDAGCKRLPRRRRPATTAATCRSHRNASVVADGRDGRRGGWLAVKRDVTIGAFAQNRLCLRTSMILCRTECCYERCGRLKPLKILLEWWRQYATYARLMKCWAEAYLKAVFVMLACSTGSWMGKKRDEAGVLKIEAILYYRSW